MTSGELPDPDRPAAGEQPADRAELNSFTQRIAGMLLIEGRGRLVNPLARAAQHNGLPFTADAPTYRSVLGGATIRSDTALGAAAGHLGITDGDTIRLEYQTPHYVPAENIDQGAEYPQPADPQYQDALTKLVVYHDPLSPAGGQFSYRTLEIEAVGVPGSGEFKSYISRTPAGDSAEDNQSVEQADRLAESMGVASVSRAELTAWTNLVNGLGRLAQQAELPPDFPYFQ